MDQKLNQFEQTLNKDMERLAEEVRDIKDRPEFKGADHKEIVKQSLRPFLPPSAKKTGDDDSATLLPQYMKKQPPEVRLEVERLLSMALRIGFREAFVEADKAGPFMTDALHDALAVRIYPELKKLGVI